jgi:hypothetical protein
LKIVRWLVGSINYNRAHSAAIATFFGAKDGRFLGGRFIYIWIFKNCKQKLAHRPL